MTNIYGALVVLSLVCVHLLANQARMIGWLWHGRFLSFAAGISFAYVFVDLLPELEKSQPILKQTFDPLIPYFDLHAYVIALLGVLFYYGIHTKTQTGDYFWMAFGGYLLFNFLVGASLADSKDPDIQPLFLFAIAMGMHYFVHDHNVLMDNPVQYTKQARWWLVASLIGGFLFGLIAHIPTQIVAILISFLAGGMILNALRYELPKREQIGYFFFVFGALFYTAIVLSIGRS